MGLRGLVDHTESCVSWPTNDHRQNGLIEAVAELLPDWGLPNEFMAFAVHQGREEGSLLVADILSFGFNPLEIYALKVGTCVGKEARTRRKLSEALNKGYGFILENYHTRVRCIGAYRKRGEEGIHAFQFIPEGGELWTPKTPAVESYIAESQN
jgi:hypothetical protein